ncbi:MAG: hypothetical protein L0Z50_23620 [Verrucomicrobiales bacterium]|nr:hypothetical protein [Verrucomicrobiales bacterium]
MKRPIRLTLNTLVAAGAMFLIVGCGKSYNATIGPDEGITKGSPVLAGTHEVPTRKVGEVRGVQVHDGQLQSAFVVDKSFASEMREGVVRVRHQGAIELRMDLATGAPMKPGAYIPLTSTFSVTAKRWSKYTPLILGGAALVAVICFLKLLLLRAAGPWIPLILVFSLAFVTAYLTHAAFLPLTQSVHAKFSSDASARPATQADTEDGKVRQAEKSFIRYVSNPVDAPRLLAFLAIFVASLVPYALLVSWLRRKLSCPAVACAVALLAALPIGSATAAPVTSVKRDDVQREIEAVEALTLRAEQLATEARRLAKAGLPLPSQTVAVRAYFLTDRAAEAEAANIGRIGMVSTWRMSADTKAAFRARYQTAAQRRAAIEDDIANTAATTTNSNNILRLYLLQREHIKARIRKGDSDEERLIKDLAKLSGTSAMASPLIAAGALTIDTDYRVENGNIILPNGEVLALGVTRVPATNQEPSEAKNTADIARLKREQQELQGAITELRRATEQTNSAPSVEHLKVLIVTNIVEKAIPVQLPSKIEFVTNTVFLPLKTENTESPGQDSLTNFQNSATTESGNTSEGGDIAPDTSNPDRSLMVAPAREPETSSGKELSTSNTSTGSQRLFRWPHGNAYVLLLGGLFLLLVSAALVVSAVRRKGPFEIELGQIEENGIQAHRFTLDNGECLVLKNRPSIEMKDESSETVIATNWRGVALLHPGTSQEVSLNGDPVHRPRALNPGDELRLQEQDTERTFVFRGVSQVEDEARDDAPFVPAQNTTQTKN